MRIWNAGPVIETYNSLASNLHSIKIKNCALEVLYYYPPEVKACALNLKVPLSTTTLKRTLLVPPTLVKIDYAVSRHTLLYLTQFAANPLTLNQVEDLDKIPVEYLCLVASNSLASQNYCLGGSDAAKRLVCITPTADKVIEHSAECVSLYRTLAYTFYCSIDAKISDSEAFLMAAVVEPWQTITDAFLAADSELERHMRINELAEMFTTPDYYDELGPL